MVVLGWQNWSDFGQTTLGIDATTQKTLAVDLNEKVTVGAENELLDGGKAPFNVRRGPYPVGCKVLIRLTSWIFLRSTWFGNSESEAMKGKLMNKLAASISNVNHPRCNLQFYVTPVIPKVIEGNLSTFGVHRRQDG
jgi:hypothetical protein